MDYAYLLLSAFLILACGIFVAAEFAFVTVDRPTVERLAGSGDSAARGLLAALRSLSTQLSGAQVGITITNLGIGFLAEGAISDLLLRPLTNLGVSPGWVPGVALTLGLTISTLLTMLFGELVPKNLAIARPLDTGRATQSIMRSFTSAMFYPIRLLNGSANLVVRALGVEPQEELRSARSSGELASLIQRSADLGTLDHETAELMERAVEFGARTAGEIMTPRVRAHSLDETDRVLSVIERARATGHSRFPVVDSEENVVGTVHVKHAVAVPHSERTHSRVKHIMMRPTLVPDSLRLDPLLALLRSDGFQLAVVLDEYGGFAGLVTLEDVIEEMVGDIRDEHDRANAQAFDLRNGSWSVSGLLRPDELEDLTQIRLPVHEDYDTIAGLLLMLLGKIPNVGDVAELPVESTSTAPRVVRLKVIRMDGRRVDRILLTELPSADPKPSESAE